MRKKLLIGNWKMNKRRSELRQFFSEFESHAKQSLNTLSGKSELGFAAPSIYLPELREILKNTKIILAAQNVHWETSGAFTGELSFEMLQDFSIDCSLIGHSERRQFFGETDETVAKKITAAHKKSKRAVLCVGELLEERNAGKTQQVVKTQVTKALSEIPNLSGIVIAYEPVWAIGTGLSATAAQAQEVHQLIRSVVSEKFGADASAKLQILYGGSLNEKNCHELISMPDIDGGLVGGASLKPKEFAEMFIVCERY